MVTWLAFHSSFHLIMDSYAACYRAATAVKFLPPIQTFFSYLTMMAVLTLHSVDDSIVNECGTVGRMKIGKGN
jgi:hypothetical protein